MSVHLLTGSGDSKNSAGTVSKNLESPHDVSDRRIGKRADDGGGFADAQSLLGNALSKTPL